MNQRIHSGALFLAVAGAMAACGGASHESPAASGTPSRTSIGVANAQRADSRIVERLAAARCDREVACNNVGGHHAKYASIDACLDDMRGSMGPELNGYDCPGGIDQGALDRCMDAIRDEGCGRPLDTLSRIDRCHTGNLCLK